MRDKTMIKSYKFRKSYFCITFLIVSKAQLKPEVKFIENVRIRAIMYSKRCYCEFSSVY